MCVQERGLTRRAHVECQKSHAIPKTFMACSLARRLAVAVPCLRRRARARARIHAVTHNETGVRWARMHARTGARALSSTRGVMITFAPPVRAHVPGDRASAPGVRGRPQFVTMTSRTQLRGIT